MHDSHTDFLFDLLNFLTGFPMNHFNLVGQILAHVINSPIRFLVLDLYLKCHFS
ncbi:hypothetical protein P343_15925 [Sporolactobacillus laevolacticus DSM 442]|uniref:Uncharacterized protein n=1 Tax=Sporolactobacillus laevolacticus DSM 442 TaxID=1395513 RepID=V6IW25_9BACL|nr:hypothetical protein P343_15925 [Sporolactobacillus laevolacticus DSM 442]